MGLYEIREQWGSTQDDPAGYPMGMVSELIVHHFFRPHVGADATAAIERGVMRSVQQFHVGQEWDDIGYGWVVFQSGRAYEGRGWFRTGAHTAGRNSKSVAIAFAINGDQYEPTEAAWETARQIAAEGIRIGALAPEYTLSGHHDYASKSCPGTKTYPIIGEHLSHRLVNDDKEPDVKHPVAIIVNNDVDDGASRVYKARLDRVLGADVPVLRHPASGVGHAVLIGAAARFKSDYPSHHVLTGASRNETGAVIADVV